MIKVVASFGVKTFQVAVVAASTPRAGKEEQG
jgi:hypothetical protein